MNVKEYARAVVLGARSLADAVSSWSVNPFTTEVNRRLWGPWPWVVLAGLTVACTTVAVLLPPFTVLAGLVPPLIALTYIPSSVRDLLYGAPALFGFVVAWRVRRLRTGAGQPWLESFGVDEAGARFFQAGALPVAVASVVLVVGVEVLAVIMPAEAAQQAVEVVEAPDDGSSPFSVVSHARSMAHNMVVVALVAGLLGVHREVGKGLGQLLGAGIFVWSMHLAIGFTVPWMVGWWSYLPIVGELAGQRSPDLVHMLFDLAVAIGAWAAALESTRRSPLWAEESPPTEDEHET